MDFLANLRKVWGDIPLTKRIGILVLTLGAAIAVGALGIWAGRPDYRLLFANIEPADADAIIRELETASVPYQIGGGGTSVYVPSDQVYRMRMKVAAAGAIKGGSTGFELFDKPSFALTDFLQDVNYTRALQGELARTIDQLEPVQQASVHLARPKESAFADREEAATASVVLKLRPGSRLQPSQVAAIASLVAHAVQGLKPENVTILDAQGRALTDLRDEKANGPVARQLEVQQSMEEYLRDKAQSMLDKAFGPDKVFVRVSAVLDFQKGEETVEKFSTGVPKRETTKETESTTPQSSGGAASVAGGGAAAAPAAPQKSSTSDSTKEYEIPKTVTRSVKDNVDVKRLAVSVLADESLAATLPKLEGIVKTAVGFDAKRGDSFEMTGATFKPAQANPADADKNVEPVGRSTLVDELIRYGATLATVIVLAVVWALLLRKGKKKAASSGGVETGGRAAQGNSPTAALAAAVAASGDHPGLQAVKDALNPTAAQLGGPAVLKIGDAASSATAVAQAQARRISSELGQLVEQSPQAAGRVLSNWIHEGRQ
ncbi:MAG: flagellar M-ring protein FliF [Planctomycetes bacterium]|nr:flagellar M-ring protein FliF [Planctomycetota bacterium]MBI3843022.1 flagellar M-ring protein FliF [Planctomycetota bacterium]